MSLSPTISDATDHPPARSGTPTAWITLGLIGLLLCGWLFSEQLATGALRAVLFGATVARGERLRVERLSLDKNRGIEMRGIAWERGPKEHRSSLRCEWAVIRLASPGSILFGTAGNERRWVREISMGKSKILADLRGAPGDEKPGGAGRAALAWVLPSAERLPSSFSAGPADIVVIGESFRVAVTGLQTYLPDRWPGMVSLGGAALDIGSRHATVPKGVAPALWDGGTLRIGALGLGEGIGLRELTLNPRPDRLEFGLRGSIGKGILRGDGSFGGAGKPERLEVTLVGERLGLEAFAGFLKDPQQATGTINQARFTFRGNPARPLEADSALRLIARNFQWEGRGWESLRIAATMTGRTLTVSELLLRQGENELQAAGQIRLPEDWRTILRAPFSATFSASLADAGSLASLAGPQLGRLGGGLAFEGEIHGADNKAEGYCNLAGSGTRIRDLSLDWLKGNILFEGEKTRVTHLEAYSGGDRIAGEGVVSNGRPHDYSAKAEVNLKNLTLRLKQLGLDTASSIGSGSVKGWWHGAGSATSHTGNFQAEITGWFSPLTRAGMSGRFQGSYTPGHLELTKADFVQDDLTVSMQLALTPATIEASSIRATRAGTSKPLLEGAVTLPVDANDFRASGDLMRTMSMDRPVSLDLRMHGIKAEELADALGQKSGFTGMLDGEISVTGTPATPEINANLRIGKFTPQAGTAGQDMTLVGETRDHRLSLRLDQAPAAKAPLALEATLPLQLANDHGRLRLADNGAEVRGSAKLEQVPLDGWIPLLGMKGIWPLLGATGTGEVKVVGTVGNPAMEGSLCILAREATLFGPEKLRNISLPFLMEGKKPAMILTNGSASYAGKPLALSGVLTVGGDAGGASVKITGSDIPVFLGNEVATAGNAELLLTSKGTNAPLLGGTVTLKPAAVDLGGRLTPCFVPPGLPLASRHPSGISPDAGVPSDLQLDLQLKTPAPADTTADAPVITADLSVKGSAQAPNLSGKVTARNQTLRLPAGTFVVPEARLVMDAAGWRIDPATAYGFTKLGPCVLTPGAGVSGTGCGFTGPAGTTAADLLMALASPPPRRGDAGNDAAPILQSPAWLRQSTLFAVPATAWGTAPRDRPVPGSLGFYGASWTWNWTESPRNTQPNTTSR